MMPTTPETDADLAALIAAGDLRARNRLVERHWRLAADVVGWLGVARRDREEATGEGILALIDCAGQYRPGMPPFRDIAGPAIRRAIRRFLRAERRVIGGARHQRAYLTRWDARLVCPDDLPAPEAVERADGVVLAAMATVLDERERAAVRRHHGMEARDRPAAARERAVRRTAEAKLRRAIAGEVT